MRHSRSATSATPALDQARRRRWRTLFGVVSLLVIAGFALLPVYHFGKAWRARALAMKAETAIAGEQWHDAAERLRAAIELAPGEPAVMRAAARFNTQVGAPHAYGYWKALLALPTVTADERREAIRFGLGAKRYELCEEQLAILRESEPANPENLSLAAQLAVEKNDPAAAMSLTDQLLDLDPAHPGALLRRGELLLSSPEVERRAQGIQQLQTLGGSNAPTALAALEALANTRDLSPSDVRVVAVALFNHPAGQTRHRLAGFSLEIRLAPDRKAELMTRAISQFRTDGPDALLTLADWTKQQGDPARILEFIPLTLSLSRQDLFLVRMDALAARKDWEEIQRILLHERTPIQTFHREVFLARVSLELHEPLPAETHWEAALDEASRNPSHLAYLARYSEKIGVLSVAAKAWRQLARKPSWALRANAALVSLLERQGDTRGLRDVMRQLRRLAPDDPAPRHDEAYLDLLLGENVPAAGTTAVKLLNDHPQRIAYRSTVALSYLRSNDPTAALQQYDGVEIPWEKASPSAQAVRAAVLHANRELTLARTAAATIPQNSLKPEERELVASLQSARPEFRENPLIAY
jgi:predicted Zn-dependent protease